ncbi:4-carboxymuconolactone decarboxylase (plasmid) [Sphingobium sp. EP60837]|nr:cupin domain-containing protein [Sphingobium sp. EP60837]ANI80144.1 4-carboxymuconolactone decarboxylase [Sphingobium sp. EP60837]
MEIMRNGSRPSSYGTEENFTGRVRRDPIHTSELPSRLMSGYVTFEPGARTRWHQHPYGQLLIITSGHGRVASWNDSVQEVSAGDVVWIKAGEKHWHGAGAHTAMTHIAVTEAENGKAVDWLEPVADAQFNPDL